MQATRTCVIPGCERTRKGRLELCGTHYARMRRTGDPLSPSIRDEWIVRFLRSCPLPDTDGCWEWEGTIGGRGYGTLTISGRTWLAHRLSYALHHGSLDERLFVCHRCDNPPCVNPAHLYLGTLQQNNQDKVDRCRLPAPLPGVHNPNARLTDDAVMAVREAVARGMTQREAARRFGIAQSHVGRIVRREAWSHV